MTTAEKFDRPTEERLRRAEGEYERIVTDIDEDGRKTPVETVRMLDGSLLDRLIRRKPPAISGDQFHAGGRFYADWYYSKLLNSGVLDPTRDIVDNGGCGTEDSERIMAAKTRYHRAIKALPPIHGMVLQCCVLHDEPLASFGCRIHGYMSLRKGSLAALTTLRDALSTLDVHYHGKRSAGIRCSNLPDYRPDGLTED